MVCAATFVYATKVELYCAYNTLTHDDFDDLVTIARDRKRRNSSLKLSPRREKAVRPLPTGGIEQIDWLNVGSLRRGSRW